MKDASLYDAVRILNILGHAGLRLADAAPERAAMNEKKAAFAAHVRSMRNVQLLARERMIQTGLVLLRTMFCATLPINTRSIPERPWLLNTISDPG